MKNNGQECNDLLEVFIDDLKSWHIVLFWEEPEHARVIEFQFIRNGLVKGQFCCYITHENREFIENEMIDNGIDVVGYTKNNMLQIIESVDFLNDSRGVLAASDAETKKMRATLSTPFRIVGGISIRDTLNMINSSDIGDRLTSAQLEIEQNFHNQLFNGLKGYWLCSYQVNDIKSALDRGSGNNNLIMAELLKSHHGVVFATKSGKGISLYLPSTL
jgi:MEDS: MEthanogen/methylotroph, DcmR Sensory domain